MWDGAKKDKTWNFWINFGFADWKKKSMFHYWYEQVLHTTAMWTTWKWHEQLILLFLTTPARTHSETWIAEFSNANKGKEIEQHIKKKYEKNSCLALLSCSDKMPCPEFFNFSSHYPWEKIIQLTGNMCIDFPFRQIAELSWKRGDWLKRLNGAYQDQCRIIHMLCLF